MHVCLVISSLGSGGAERVVATLANEWVRADQKVTIVTLASADADFFAIDRRITRRQLRVTGDSGNLFRGGLANLRRLRILRKELRTIDPDVIVSFVDTTNVLVIVATLGLGVPVVVCERSDPRAMPIRRSWALMRRVTYPMARLLVVQTRSVDQWAKRNLRSKQTVVLPNPVGDEWFELGSATRQSARHKRVAGLGRLGYEKGFDVLIDAFARVSADHPEWWLEIAGAGPLESALKRQVRDYRVTDRVEFAGLVSDPGRFLADSEIFVLSSRYEGFPNALIEAMASGCAVVATDCPSGPSEIVADDRDGLLVSVDDSRLLAHTLDTLMRDDARRRRLGAEATLSALRFRVSDVARRWLDTLALIAAPRADARCEDDVTPLVVSER